MKTDGKFEQIYSRNADTVYRICVMHLKSRHDAEDAVQSVFLKYLKKPRDFPDTEQEKAWFIVAARNYCRDILKCWWISRRTDMESLPEPQTPPENGESELAEKLMSLPAKYKEVLYLYYYEGYAVKEIAVLLGRNESTVRTQLSKGRERLKQKLENERRGCYEK